LAANGLTIRPESAPRPRAALSDWGGYTPRHRVRRG
jgi:hypothetical protein